MKPNTSNDEHPKIMAKGRVCWENDDVCCQCGEELYKQGYAKCKADVEKIIDEPINPNTNKSNAEAIWVYRKRILKQIASLTKEKPD